MFAVYTLFMLEFLFSLCKTHKSKQKKIVTNYVQDTSFLPCNKLQVDACEVEGGFSISFVSLLFVFLKFGFTILDLILFMLMHRQYIFFRYMMLI
jgi:hypothetical protein